MKKLLKRFLMMSGMALSFGAGYRIAKKKFDYILDTQIEEIKKAYEEEYKKPQEEKPNTTNSYIPEGGIEFMKKYSSPQVKEVIDEVIHYNYDNMISIISPMEFGEDESYETIGLTYYFDGVLARDDDDTIIEDIDDVIGIGSLKYLGDYAEGVLYIKNDILGAYYEITESDKTYTEVTGQ